MSTIKVDKLQGTSGAVTGLTFSGANGTFGGTLAVTGVHTIGNNAVITSEGGAVTPNLVQGLAKGWVNFNGSSFGTRDSYNIGSVTDVSAGTYVPNFTSDMSNANYTITLVCGDNMHNTTLHNSLVATGSYRIHNLNDAGSFADTSIVMANVHGDLA